MLGCGCHRSKVLRAAADRFWRALSCLQQVGPPLLVRTPYGQHNITPLGWRAATAAGQCSARYKVSFSNMQSTPEAEQRPRSNACLQLKWSSTGCMLAMSFSVSHILRLPAAAPRQAAQCKHADAVAHMDKELARLPLRLACVGEHQWIHHAQAVPPRPGKLPAVGK